MFRFFSLNYKNSHSDFLNVFFFYRNKKVGRPIPCEKNPNPTREQISVLKELYLEELRNLYNKYKPIYDPDGDLMFVWSWDNRIFTVYSISQKNNKHYYIGLYDSDYFIYDNYFSVSRCTFIWKHFSPFNFFYDLMRENNSRYISILIRSTRLRKYDGLIKSIGIIMYRSLC